MPSPSDTTHQHRRPGFLVRLVLLLIKGYQLLISPWLGNNCRYTPSCSHYTAQALVQHGLLRGGLLGMWRIVRCTPWHSGGYDPVPPAGCACSHHTNQQADNDHNGTNANANIKANTHTNTNANNAQQLQQASTHH